jgi:hypothetical protein
MLSNLMSIGCIKIPVNQSTPSSPLQVVRVFLAIGGKKRKHELGIVDKTIYGPIAGQALAVFHNDVHTLTPPSGWFDEAPSKGTS